MTVNMQLQQTSKKLAGWSENTLSSDIRNDIVSYYALLFILLHHLMTHGQASVGSPSAALNSSVPNIAKLENHTDLGGDSAEEADTSWLREREEELATNREATSVVRMWFGYENFDKEQKYVLCEIG